MVSADGTDCKSKLDVWNQRCPSGLSKQQRSCHLETIRDVYLSLLVWNKGQVLSYWLFCEMTFCVLIIWPFSCCLSSLLHWQHYEDQLHGRSLENVYIFGSFWVRWVHKILGAEWWYHFSPLYFTGQIFAAAQRIGRIQARELAFSIHFCS